MNPLLAQAAPLPTVSNAVPLSSLETLLANVVSVFLGLAGIALFLMLVIGGIKWLTAAGDPKAVEAARSTITSAISGVVLLALALLILVFIQDFTGADVINFRVFIP